jgi:hypothetical protein
MWSILTLTSELCECFGKVLMTVFQSLNGRIRNRVVIFIILNLGRDNIFLRYFKHLKTLYYWLTGYVYVSCLNFSQIYVLCTNEGPLAPNLWLATENLRFS